MMYKLSKKDSTLLRLIRMKEKLQATREQFAAMTTKIDDVLALIDRQIEDLKRR